MLFLIFLLSLTSVFLFFSRFRSAEASDLWFNDLWIKRQKIVINYAASGDAPNFIAEASLATNSLIDAGFMNNNCSDIRVVDTNLNILSHWVDPETCNTSKTNIYFQVPFLYGTNFPNLGQNTFYIYYANTAATVSTVAASTIFTATIPNLKANYSFEDISSGEILDDRSDLGNNAKIINTINTFPGGATVNKIFTFPEGYSKKAFFFNGQNVYISTPIPMINLSNAYSLITYVKPEGTRANGYMVRGESMGKIFNFENIDKNATYPCVIDEYQEGDGVASCFANGLRYTPDAITQKKTGSYTYYYDSYFNKITRPSLAVTFNGTTQSLFQSNPTNFTPLLTTYNDFGFFYKIKPYGDVGDRRTIHSWGITAPNPANKSYALDYNVCSDGSLRFILDYNNSTDEVNTLATPCLNNIAPSTKISSIAGNYSIYANSNTYLNLATAQFAGTRYIAVNGVIVASDATADVTIARNVPMYVGRASNTNKSNFKGEIDEYNSFGEDLSWFRGAYYTGGVFNSTIHQLITNTLKKSYVIFANSDDDFFQAGFSNHANSRYNTATATSNFNYNFNTSDSNDFYQQYGGNLDSNLNSKASFISSTFNLFDGSWYQYATQFDNTANTITSRFNKGASTYNYTNTYTNVNTNGGLLIGAFVNENHGTSTYPSEFYFGGMDDVFVYSATLSTTQLNLHSQPWNGYSSYGKTLWQSPLTSSAIGTLTFNQDFPEETQNVYWYDKDYPYRLRVNIDSIPVITIPNFQVTFNIDTSTPISNQRMNTDCSGIVITDDFYRVLPFWIENCNSTSSKFYIKMNPDSSGTGKYSVKGGSNQNVFIYYGNKKSNARTYPPSQVFDAAISGLNSAYTFDDVSGNVAPDISGIGSGKSLGIREGASFSEAGVFGKSIFFSGLDNEEGSFPYDGTSAELSYPGISMLAWVRIDDTSAGRNAIFLENNQYIFHEFSIANSTNLLARYKLKGDLLASSPLPTPTTNFIFTGFSHDYNEWAKVITNRAISSAPGTSSDLQYFSFIDKIYVGASPSDAFRLSGAVDEIRVFNKPLTDTELLAYTTNTTIGSSRFDTSVNTCNQVNNYCTKSYVTPSYPGYDLLGKYNSNLVYTTNPEERFASPQIYFKFNEGKGIYLGDSAGKISTSFLGNTRPSTSVGPVLTGQEPNWALENKCIEGQCLYFDGLNDIVSISTIPGGDADVSLLKESDYTYSFWIKPLSNPNSRQTIISFGTSDAREGYVLYLDSNMRIFTYATHAGTYINSSASTLPINKWSHVSFTFKEEDYRNRFYINGEFDTSNTNPSTCYSSVICNPPSNTKIFLGGNAASQNYDDDYFRGYLDEFKIYRTNLDTDTIRSEYRKGLNTLKYNLSAESETVTNFNLMAYYPFDEIDRSVAFDYSDIKAEASYPSSSNINIAGVFNNAFSSPGTGTDTVRIPNNNFINLNSQASYSLWVRVIDDSVDDKYLLYKAGSGGFHIKYNAVTEKYSASLCGTNLETSGTFGSFSAMPWDNIVITSNSKKVKLFVNSVLQDEDYCFNSYTSDKSNTNPIRVGGDGSANGTVEGLIDEFRIYDNYLSNKQVQLLYSYKPIYSAYGNNAISFYKLDSVDGTTTASDSSGNNNNLTMFDSATNQNSWNTFGKIGNSYDFTTNASTTKNLFSVGSSTMSVQLTQPFSLMGWAAFSEPFYGDYSLSQIPSLMYIGPTTPTGNDYSSLSIRPQTNRILNLNSFFNNSDTDRLQFSSPYLYLTIASNTPIWNHVAATYDGYLRHIYVNGDLVKVDTGTSNTVSIGGSSIVLGGFGGNQSNTQFQYNGMLDEAKIYNYARSQDQIKMDMRNAGTSPALNSNIYNSIRSNQKPSTFMTGADNTIYPVVEINFDSYFKSNSILVSQSPVTLEEITFENVPSNVSNYQIKFSLPVSNYNAENFTHANCGNIYLTDEMGRRLQYWAEPNSCKNGTGVLVAKIPVTGETQFIKVKLDPATTPSGMFRDYSSNVTDIFDFSIPDLELAHNFEETTGILSYDSSGWGRNINWYGGRDNTSTGAFGRAPFLNGSTHFGIMDFSTNQASSEPWPGFTFLGWIYPTSNKTMTLFDFNRRDESNYFSYGRFFDEASTNYQRVSFYNSRNYEANNNDGTEYLFRGFSVRFQGASATDYMKFYDDGAITATSSTGKQDSFPSSFSNVCIGRINVDFECLTNSEGWVGSFDELRIFSRELSLPEYQAYMKNSINSYTPLGNSGVIGYGAGDPDNICNLQNNWCTKSFVTPSYPGVELLGKYNSKVTPTYVTLNQPLFSVANNGAIYIQNGGVRGGSAYFFTVGSEKNINLYAPFFNFGQGSDAAISFYIKTDNSSLGSIASSTGLKINKLNGNQINFSGANFNLTSTRTLPTNNWSHVFFQKNGQTGVFELVIDNELQAASYSATNSLDLSDFKFTLTEGRSYNLDEVKIYDTVLNQNSITNLYQGGFGIKFSTQRSSYCVDGSSAFCSSPTKEYLFNEVSGQTAYNNSNSEDPSPLSVGTTTSRITGFTGKGLSFNYLDTDTFATNLINNSGEGSLSFRYKSAFYGGSTGDFIFSGKGISLRSYNDSFSVVPAGSFTTDTELSLYGAKDPWHHININYNTSFTPAQLVLYFDGVKMISGTYTKNSTDEKWMFSKGVLDNLRSYSYQRDAAQVAHEYADGKPFAYFKFDECAGNNSYNSNLNLYKPLQFRENGSRTDASGFLNTGLVITRPSGALNFGTCTDKQAPSNYNIGQNGKYNSSFYFDGNVYMEGNDYHSRVFNSEGNATITFWINIQGNSLQDVNLIGSADATNSHLINLNTDNKIVVKTNSDAATNVKLTSTKAISSSDWTHVAIVFENGSGYKIYLNGILDNSSSGNFTSILNTCTGGRPVVCTNRPFVVGKNFTGKLDELKIYNYPITLNQIKIDLNEGAAVRIE